MQTTPVGTLVLNPNATPFEFQPRQSQENGRKKAKSKKKTRDPPTDVDGIDLEFARLEISTTRAKLQELETTINELKLRNSILSDRNKILEQAKKQEIYERYFPSQTGDHPKPAGTQAQAGQSGCCHHTAMHHCCRTCTCMDHRQSSSNCTDESHKNSINNISEKLSNLAKDVEDLKQKRDNSPPQADSVFDANFPLPNQKRSSHPPNHVPNPDIVTFTSPTRSDSSMATIDEHMPDDTDQTRQGLN